MAVGRRVYNQPGTGKRVGGGKRERTRRLGRIRPTAEQERCFRSEDWERSGELKQSTLDPAVFLGPALHEAQMCSAGLPSTRGADRALTGHTALVLSGTVLQPCQAEVS